MKNYSDAIGALDAAWPQICSECLSVLGSELHYQAMIYHCLRSAGQVPLKQLGMNVKQWITDVQSELFKNLDSAKHEKYRGGFEPIPDIVIFSEAVNADWRRRNSEQTLMNMLLVIEVKASERAGSRLSASEVSNDIRKLAAHREESRAKGADFHPVMMVIDSAPAIAERMKPAAVSNMRALAKNLGVEWRYLSPSETQVDRNIGS